jgi:hypothetical protein
MIAEIKERFLNAAQFLLAIGAHVEEPPHTVFAEGYGPKLPSDMRELIAHLTPKLPEPNDNSTGYVVEADGSFCGQTFKCSYWTPGDGEAMLDGQFTAEELRAIAAHMEAKR